MFMNYRILKKLEFGNYVSVETACNFFPNTSLDKVGRSIVMLVGMGFIDYDPDCNVSLKRITSLYEYKNYVGRKFFEFTVSISAIVMAIANVIAVLK